MGKQKTMKRYEELEFRDDFMFGKVMEDSQLCHDVLECLMRRPVGKLTKLETQKEIRYIMYPIRWTRQAEGIA